MENEIDVKKNKVEDEELKSWQSKKELDDTIEITRKLSLEDFSFILEKAIDGEKKVMKAIKAIRKGSFDEWKEVLNRRPQWEEPIQSLLRNKELIREFIKRNFSSGNLDQELRQQFKRKRIPLGGKFPRYEVSPFYLEFNLPKGGLSYEVLLQGRKVVKFSGPKDIARKVASKIKKIKSEITNPKEFAILLRGVISGETEFPITKNVKEIRSYLRKTCNFSSYKFEYSLYTFWENHDAWQSPPFSITLHEGRGGLHFVTPDGREICIANIEFKKVKK